MDLKKEISFGGGKAPKYPTKTTINLVKQRNANTSAVTTVLLFVIAVIIIGIFAKFFVVDPLATNVTGNIAIASAQSQLAELKAEAADYPKISAEYEKYVVIGKSEEEASLANRADLIDLLESKVMNATNLQSVKVNGNKVVITCAGVSLQTVSGLVQSLEQDDRVAYVTVSTAASKDAAIPGTATIEMLLKSPDGATNDTGSAAKGGTNG